MTRLVCITLAIVLLLDQPLLGQSSSIYQKALEKKQADAAAAMGKEKFGQPESVSSYQAKILNPELERTSLIAVATKPPNEFKVHDIITVIVREQLEYESDSTLETKRKFTLETELTNFLRMLNGHLAAASFTDGKPDIDFKMNTRLKSEGDAERNDKLTFRMTVEIIDIKPNGQLVLSGRQQNIIDDEAQMMTFTGICRSQDVTPDNSILSTQVFDQRVNVQNSGAVRKASERGWLLKLIDRFQPF